MYQGCNTVSSLGLHCNTASPRGNRIYPKYSWVPSGSVGNMGFVSSTESIRTSTWLSKLPSWLVIHECVLSESESATSCTHTTNRSTKPPKARSSSVLLLISLLKVPQLYQPHFQSVQAAFINHNVKGRTQITSSRLYSLHRRRRWRWHLYVRVSSATGREGRTN